MVRVGPDDICGIFELRSDAERARDELLGTAAGLRSEDLVLLTPDEAVRPFAATPARRGLWLRGDAALGGLVGGTIGGLIGTLLATGAFPGIPLLWGGGGAAIIVGAFGGLAVGAIVGALVGWGLGADRYSFFAQEIEAGRTVLVVHHPPAGFDVSGALQRHGAIRVGLAQQPSLAHPHA